MTPYSVEQRKNSTVVDFPLRSTSVSRGSQVNRISGYYLYQVGAAIRPVTFVQPGTTNAQFRVQVLQAQQWTIGVLTQTLLPLKTSVPKGWELVDRLKEAQRELDALGDDNLGEHVEFMRGWSVSSVASEFQTLLNAELSMADLYVVGRKGVYDVTQLAENGVSVFPSALATKVPDALFDAAQAARCIAFALPTAAAFHSHLVLERVMRAYYNVVTAGKPHPDSRNVSAYIDAMKNHQVGDKRIFAALADIARFHRNPVLHPEDRLDTVEDAVALLGSIYSAMLQMLKAIPDPELKLVVQDAETKAA